VVHSKVITNKVTGIGFLLNIIKSTVTFLFNYSLKL